MECMRERVLIVNFQPVGRIEYDLDRLDRCPAYLVAASR